MRREAKISPPLLALLLGLLPGATSTAASAPQWVAVAAETGRTVEVDKSRIGRLAGGKTAAWTRLTLDHPVLDFEGRMRYTAVQALNHYDCAQGRFATQKRVFLLDGKEMKSEKVSGPQLAVKPDSMDAKVLEEVCRPRTVGEMQQTAQRAAAAAEAAGAARPRPMHAEMVSAAGAEPPRSVKVADAKAPAPLPAAAPPAEKPADKPRLFDMPQIDKSKAEDPYKNAGAPPPAAKPPAKPVQTSPAKPAARPAQPLPQLPELSRQQRELMLATSGPRKLVPKKKEPEAPAPDYSKVHWGYAGLGAPENWAKIRPDYATCATGSRQSPIDIRGGIKVDLEPIRFDYRPAQFRIVDNGHTIQVDVGEGSSITVTGRTYPLVQLHFHRPAEEKLNGRTYDMSVHLVHQDYDGTLAVVAVLLERGAEHPVIQTLWNYMPLEVGMEVMPPNVFIDLAKLLPERREYYTYMGSLTTPPCTENVLWMVMKQPLQVSPQQIGIFARLYPHNARPVQPVNERLIKESR